MKYIYNLCIYSIVYYSVTRHRKIFIKCRSKSMLVVRREKFLSSQKCEKGKRGSRSRKIREFDSTDTKRASRDWCHFLPGMLSGRLLLLMECFVRARNPGEHSRPSRERETSLHGWSILLTHALYKSCKVHTKDNRSRPDGRIR